MAERGGTSEQHAQAGRAGGQATATRGQHFYEEIGQKGGRSRGESSQASAAHHEAASHHEAAAHHHRAAAFAHSQGDDETANSHAEHGHAHSETAHKRSTEARDSSGRFTKTRN